MDDLTFLRNLAQRGRVALLASAEGPGTVAVPAPMSVLDDDSRAGATFRIGLLSPEDVWSGDGRKFEAGTIEHRDLPLPLLWQPMLDDGHKTAVIVGRMDSMERTPFGWGEVRGVFDTGPWGREAQRLNDAGMLRFVSADYDLFEAVVVEKNDDDDEVIKDNRILVKKSRIMAATMVAKPAYQEAMLEITTNPDILDGEYFAEPMALMASADSDLITQLQLRLARLEHVQELRRQDELTLLASAARERIFEARQHSLERAAAEARERFSITAASKFAKAPAKPAARQPAQKPKPKQPAQAPARNRAPAAKPSKPVNRTPVKPRSQTTTTRSQAAPSRGRAAPARGPAQGTKPVITKKPGSTPSGRKARAYERFPAGTGDSRGGEFAPGNNEGAKPAKAARPAATPSGGSGGSGGGSGSSTAPKKSATPAIAKVPDTKKTAVQLSDYLALADSERAAYLEALNDAQLQKLTRDLFKSTDSTEATARARAAITSEMEKRKQSIYDYGADDTGLRDPTRTVESRNGLELTGIVDKDIKTLQALGWKGDPTDKNEALYPPEGAKPIPRGSLSAKTVEKLTDAGWKTETIDDMAQLVPPGVDGNGVPVPPKNHGQYARVQSYEDGAALYTDGYVWDPDTKTFRLPKNNV